MEGININLLPYLAAAIARNERAYSRGRMLYYGRPSECEAAALKSGLKNHRAITSSRTEYELKARQMIGVLCCCDEGDVTSVIAHGWRQLYTAIKSNKRANLDGYRFEDSDASDLLFIVAYLCSVLERPFPERFKPLVIELVQTYEQAAGDSNVSKEDIAVGKAWFASRGTGTAALDNVPSREDGAPFELLAHLMGLGLSDYLYGISLTTEQKGLCALAAEGKESLAAPLGLFAMLINAIKADRRYLLDTHAERLIIDAKTAQIESANSREEAARLRDQLKRALATMAELKAQIERLEADKLRLDAELAEHDGDAQELAALRSALYAAEREENPEPIEAVPPLPNGLRVVCMGGHQRWIAQMREALPDITYIPAGSSADEQIIRNADAVWFRADYISHSAYAPAIAVCRAGKIPVYYFSAGGAERCAAELCRTMAARKE